MRNPPPIQARTQEKWPAHFIQELENVFQDAVEFFRQVGLSQEQISAFFQLNTFFQLIEKKVHYYRVQEEEMTRH